MWTKGLGIAVLVISFCLIAIFSRYEAVKHPDNKREHQEGMVRYVERGLEKEHGVELQLLKRDGERYAVYRTIDNSKKVRELLRILKQAEWREAHVSMDRMPDYKIETIRAEEPLTYAVWVTPRRNIELIIEGKSRYVKLDDRASRTMLALLDSANETIWDGQDDAHRPRFEPAERIVPIEG